MCRSWLTVPLWLALTLLVPCAVLPAQAQPAQGPVTVVTILDVVPDYAMTQNVETSAALLRKLSEDTRVAPGRISFQVLVDASRPNHFVILGVWKDMPSFAAYTAAATTRAFRQALAPRQGGPFDERIYVDLK